MGQKDNTADHDRAYQAWRERHMRECDAHYAAFCAETGPDLKGEPFDRVFEDWRRSRAQRDARSTRMDMQDPTDARSSGDYRLG